MRRTNELTENQIEAKKEFETRAEREAKEEDEPEAVAADDSPTKFRSHHVSTVSVNIFSGSAEVHFSDTI